MELERDGPDVTIANYFSRGTFNLGIGLVIAGLILLIYMISNPDVLWPGYFIPPLLVIIGIWGVVSATDSRIEVSKKSLVISRSSMLESYRKGYEPKDVEKILLIARRGSVPMRGGCVFLFDFYFKNGKKERIEYEENVSCDSNVYTAEKIAKIIGIPLERK
jgi:hypothetical protein